MIRNVFIAGTDTEIGKTFAACTILRWLNRTGRTAVGMKPVAAGAIETPAGRVNEDAVRLRENGACDVDYASTNPYLFDDPTSPDIASALAGRPIELARITRAYAACRAAAGFVVVEGVGGWRVPLGPTLQTADLVRALDLPVILVCGIRLGCISHGLLSGEAIVRDGIELAGWIANIVDPRYAYGEASIATLAARMPAPLLGEIAWRAPGDPDKMSTDLKASLGRLFREPAAGART